MSYFCDIEGREAKEIVPGIRIRTFWQDKMLVSVVDLEPGATVPAHNHVYEQSGTVISGEMDMTIDGETRTLKAGDCYIIPGGIDHKAVGGPEGAHVIDIFAPVRPDYQY